MPIYARVLSQIGQPTAATESEDCPAWMAGAVLALLCVACSAPLLDAGWFDSHEKIRPIARALAAWYEIADGDFYPRWLSTGYDGRGVPLFNYYPPAFSLLVAYAHALGIPLLLAAKLTIFVLFLAGGFGAYLWVRPHLGSYPALVAGILYLFAPYHFVDLYVRGATAEFASLAALPWLFHAIDRLVGRRSWCALASLSVASAAIVLSHFLSALMIAPFAAVYGLARAAQAGDPWAPLGRIAAGGALGAALSAFFWLPALAERDALSAERQQMAVSGLYTYFLHFVHPRQWLDPSWGFGSSTASLDDGMSFQVGILLLAAAAGSSFVLPRLGRPARGFVLLALGLGAAAIWLTSSTARFWYSWFPPFQLVQFPWRYLGPATLFLAAAGGGGVRVLCDGSRRFGPGLALLTAAVALLLSGQQRTVKGPIGLADDRAAIERAIAGDPWSAKFGNEDEFLPRYAKPEAANGSARGRQATGVGVAISDLVKERKELAFEATARAGGGLVVIPWHAFPGWDVSLDGREWHFVPQSDGYLGIPIPEGRHAVRVHFGTTLPRIVGWLLTSAAVVTLGLLAVRERRA